ncbi:unnamed protein product [Lathyrus sativus]|nr:unnamed protein product [Lathyrus sativus]
MKKKKRKCIKSSQQSLSSTNSIIITEPEFYLPEDCWEHVLSFIINPLDDGSQYIKSLSLVSKQFLSITNRLLFSLRIYHPQLCFLYRFFHRFSNLNSLDLWFSSRDLHPDIALALRDRPTLKSLSIFGIDLKGPNYVTSQYIDSFVSLKGLISLKIHCSQISDDFLCSFARQGLSFKSFILKNCTGYNYPGIYGLLSKCGAIQHLSLQPVDFLNNHHVFQLSLLLPGLISINLSQNSNLTKLALFALIKNCHSLNEITMENIYNFGGESVENSDIMKDFNVNPQLKFLHFSNNSLIKDEILILFASIFPNLQLLDLTFCYRISEKGICHVLSRCCELRHLTLDSCFRVRGLKMNFTVHQLEVLDLSNTKVDDRTLYEISKSCFGLLKLLLTFCEYVTEKGVIHVVKNCTQLKEIYLILCDDNVNVDLIVSTFSSRPSLRVFS